MFKVNSENNAPNIGQISPSSLQRLGFKSASNDLERTPDKDSFHTQEHKKEIEYGFGIGISVLLGLGILGHKGHLGKNIQKLLGGIKKETANTVTDILTTPEAKAKKALADAYDKVIKEAKLAGNTNRVANFENCKNKIETLEKKGVYLELVEVLYKNLRLHEYPTSGIATKNIEKITEKPNSLIKVTAKDGWHYRLPINRTDNKNTVDRVSVNALADENLIKALDDLFGNGHVKGYYKTPDQSANWLERHDPITIYLDEKATPETLDKIKQACEKYIRSKEDVLCGDKFAPGFALQKSPNTNDIKELLDRAKDLDPDLEDALRKYFTDHASGKVKISAGYFDCIENLISLCQ